MTTKVRRRAEMVQEDEASSPGLLDWESLSGETVREVWREIGKFQSRYTRKTAPGIINFSRLTADRRMCPTGDLAGAVKRAILAGGKDLLDYGDPQGFLPLREYIARRMRIHSMTVSAADILTTNGAQHALELVVKLLAGPGCSIMVESPTYATALPLFRLYGVRLLEAPMRSDGMDLDAVERILSTERVSFIYTIPNFQNPTGITTSQAHRERLLSLCQNHRTPLVEDGFEEEMKYFGKAILPIKSMDRGNLVIYLGTFSKILFPGLRVGWVAAESGCIQRLTAIQRFCSLSGNTLGQAAVYYFCARGHYDTHVRRMHRAYRKRLTTLLHGMREYFPARGIEWTEPVGGYTCWVRLPGTTITESELEEQLLSEGVMVTSGSLFCPTPSETLSFRISISDLNENEIETGIRRLGRVLHRITGG